MKHFAVLLLLCCIAFYGCSDNTTDPVPDDNTTGLFAHYPFDGNANDVIGGLNGAVHNANLCQDRFGNENSAYEFSGNNSFIQVPFAEEFNFEDDFTFSLWIKTDIETCSPYDTHIDLISKYGEIGPKLSSFYLGITTNSCLESWTNNGNVHTWIGTEKPLNYYWHQVVLVFDKTDNDKGLGTIYLDGEIYISGVMNVPQESVYDLFFASRPGNGANFSGKLDDIKIYKKALSEQEVKEQYTKWEPPTKKPPVIFAHYPFDGNANDIIGGLNGVVTNAQLCSDRFGNEHSAYEFSGNSSFIQVPFAEEFNFEDDFTFSLWIQADIETSSPYDNHIDLISKYGEIGPKLSSFYLGITTNSCLESWMNNGNGHSWIGTERPLNYNWHHIVLVFDKKDDNIGVGTIYLDGDIYISGVMNVPQESVYDLFFASRPGNGANYAGKIDDIKIYKESLSKEDVKDLYMIK